MIESDVPIVVQPNEVGFTIGGKGIESIAPTSALFSRPMKQVKSL